MRDFLVGWFCFTDVAYTVIPTEKKKTIFRVPTTCPVCCRQY